MGKFLIVGVSMTIVLCTGCASMNTWPSIFPSEYPTVSHATPSSSCEALGALTAEADCACYDKMSYLQVEAKANHNLARAAYRAYPETDLVQVSDVDLFLNNAVVHGVAYRCDSSANES